MDREEWLKYCDKRNKFRKKCFYPEVVCTHHKDKKLRWVTTGRMIKLERKVLPISKRAA